MQIVSFSPTTGFGSNTYLLISEGEYAVIDPSVPFAKTQQIPGLPDKKLKYVILTHAHFDHMLYVDEWVQNSEMGLLVSENDSVALSDPEKNAYLTFLGESNGYFGSFTIVDEINIIKLGDTEISFLMTPGHTCGSIAIILENSIFVGDTVFAMGAYGRTDLWSGNPDLLFRSIKRICTMPEDMNVYPGHGPKTTVGQIKKYFR